MEWASWTIYLWTELGLPWRDRQAKMMREQDYSQEFNSSLEWQQRASNPRALIILGVASAWQFHTVCLATNKQ